MRQICEHVYRDGDITLTGEVYQPDARPLDRAILVVHEADGIGGNVRRHCDMLARRGYVAFAADMHGCGRPLDAAEIPPALQRFRDDPAYFRRRVQAGLDAMKAVTGFGDAQIAAIGYCFGGTAVLELARSGASLAAVASFHGLLTTASPAWRGQVAARILACTGARDPLVPVSDVTAFQEEMAAAEADWQLAVFGRALHSFTNADVDRLGDERMAFDAEAEHMSWTMLEAFLERSFALRASSL